MECGPIHPSPILCLRRTPTPLLAARPGHGLANPPSAPAACSRAPSAKPRPLTTPRPSPPPIRAVPCLALPRKPCLAGPLQLVPLFLFIYFHFFSFLLPYPVRYLASGLMKATETARGRRVRAESCGDGAWWGRGGADAATLGWALYSLGRVLYPSLRPGAVGPASSAAAVYPLRPCQPHPDYKDNKQ